ncbi:30S ribosomal protein S21 [Chloroflexota bacterium]
MSIKRKVRFALDVLIREGESQESLLRRFQRSVQLSGVLSEVKSRRYFLSRRDAARIKSKKARRKQR